MMKNLIRLCALALASKVTYGYLDTSPFFMFSTSELLTSTSQIQPASSILSDVSRSLSHCPSEVYIIISQPGVSTKDYTTRKSSSTLAQKLSTSIGTREQNIRSSISISEVVGDLDVEKWQNQLESNCGVHTTEIDVGVGGSIPASYETYPRLLNVYFEAPSKQNPSQDLSLNDAFFASIMDLLPSKNYTVLYTTSTSRRSKAKLQNQDSNNEAKDYQMDPTLSEQAMHLELRRGLSQFDTRQSVTNSSNQNMIDGPLFAKYQFFTPGIFMGLLVGFLLLSLLYVGISALTSLQVSYAAFDKETGQLATKKQ